MAQIISGADSVKQIAGILRRLGCKKLLLVCDSSYPFLPIKESIDALPVKRIVFSGFTSNPLYEDVCRGVELFRSEGCDTILAVGGGSSIDVAKCVKLYCKMDASGNYLKQELADTGVPVIAVPTTAGTGSESTRYAVIYYEGKKQSVTHESIIPNYAILDPTVLKTLPLYQKKCTMLDALCQGIESWWSIHSTEESKGYAKEAVRLIVENMDGYLSGSDEAAEKIMLAANLSGRAINITQTTAAHAMSYKLTSLYGLPHGHAVAVCLPEVWAYMLGHIDRCADDRGAKYLKRTFDGIAKRITNEQFREIMRKLGIKNPIARDRAHELDILVDAVNPVRLKNNPVTLDGDAIRAIYERIVLS